MLNDIEDSTRNGFETFFEWLPNLIGALVILLIGWIVARVIASLVRTALRKANLDSHVLKGRTGDYVQRVVTSPTKLVGTVVFWVIMFGTFSLAASVLGIDALERLVAAVYAYLPNVLAALVIFLVAAALAAGVAGLVARVMGDTPTGKVVATAAPILIMTIATFMILTQLRIAPEIVTITYAGIIGAIALGTALAFGLGGRDAAARALETAVDKGKEHSSQVKQDMRVGRDESKRVMQEHRSGSSRDSDDLPRVTDEPLVTSDPGISVTPEDANTRASINTPPSV